MTNFLKFIAGLVVTFFKAIGRSELLEEQIKEINRVQQKWDEIDERPDTIDGALDDLRRRSKDRVSGAGKPDPGGSGQVGGGRKDERGG